MAKTTMGRTVRLAVAGVAMGGFGAATLAVALAAWIAGLTGAEWDSGTVAFFAGFSAPFGMIGGGFAGGLLAHA